MPESTSFTTAEHELIEVALDLLQRKLRRERRSLTRFIKRAIAVFGDPAKLTAEHAELQLIQQDLDACRQLLLKFTI